MKRLNIAVCSIFLSVFFATNCFAEPTLTWVYMADAAPINWIDENGKAKGAEVEIVEYICSKLGIKVEHKMYPWPRSQKMVESGKADAMMTTPNKSRFNYAIYGKENVLPCYWNIFIRKDDAKMQSAVLNFKGLVDLKPYEILDFNGNGWAAAFLAGSKGYSVHNVNRLAQIPAVFMKGRTDLIMNSSSWMKWWFEKNGSWDQVTEIDVDWPWTRFHFVCMVSRKSPWAEKGLVRAMDIEIVKMKKSGKWIEILKKYKNPHGLGKPVAYLGDEYMAPYLKEYDTYPIYKSYR